MYTYYMCVFWDGDPGLSGMVNLWTVAMARDFLAWHLHPMGVFPCISGKPWNENCRVINNSSIFQR